MDQSKSFSGPSNSQQMSARRLPVEPPACVQNAMMSKDKKPFTYTPGGIDLSQIKSPRMAKRISRNARNEGITNQPKMSPLAQNNSPQSPLPAAASIGAAAMGMPFQVFPTGPPMPPPPPPPPPMAKTQTTPQKETNGKKPNSDHKILQTNNFEPPPLGCRPEIKIPPNPLSNLKPAPRPQPKDDYWIEEYRNEKLGNSADNYRRDAPENYADTQRASSDSISPQDVQKEIKNGDISTHMQPQSPCTYNQSPVPKNLPPPITPTKVSTNELNQKPPINTTPQPALAQKPQALGSLYIPPPNEVFASNKQTLLNQQSPSWMSSRQNSKNMPNWVHKDDIDYVEPIQEDEIKNDVAPVSKMTTTPVKMVNEFKMPLQYMPLPQQYDIVDDVVPVARTTTTPVKMMHEFKIPPQYTPSPRQNDIVTSKQEAPKLQPSVLPTNQKERIIPIQIEQSPIRMASSPGFGPPPPYYSPSPNQQYTNMASPIVMNDYSSPISGHITPNAMFSHPNQFVNQGYNNISYPNAQQQQHQQSQQQQQQQQQQHLQHQQQLQHQQRLQQQQLYQQQMQQQQQRMYQTQQPPGTRIIPIQIEGSSNGNNVMKGHLGHSPAVIQTDPRSSYNQGSSNGNTTPNQSRSFRVLQQITDTGEEDSENIDQINDMNENQLRKMQVNSEDRSSLNRVNAQGTTNVQKNIQNKPYDPYDEGMESNNYIPPSEQQVVEPKKYTGSSVPGRSFKMLQARTQPENAGPGQSDL